MTKQSEIDALIRLLDDEDDIITENVSQKILSLGESVVFSLEKAWENTSDELLQERIENLIHKIQFHQIKIDLAEWLKEENPDLIAGAEIIARYQFTDLNTNDWKKQFASIRQKIWLELNNDLTPLETISIFNHVLYGQLSFQGIYLQDTDINDFCINYAVETKKGSAIMLGIIYTALAQELNIPVYGVCLQNHFIICYQKKFIQNFEKEPATSTLFYVNPVNKGAVFGRNEITKYLEDSYFEKEDKNYQPASSKNTIKELLEYIKLYFTKAKKEDSVQEINDLLEMF